MSNWFPLKTCDHFSIQRGLSKPDQIASKIVEYGYSGCATTNLGSISGAFTFHEEMKSVQKKAILGCQFYLTKMDPWIKKDENKGESLITVIAKNANGWKDLIGAVSMSNDPDVYYHKPRLGLDGLLSWYKGDWFVFSGTLGSEIGNAAFENPQLAYLISDYEQARQLVHPKWKERVLDKIKLYREKFGQNFFLEVQLIDQKSIPANLILARIVRKLGDELGIPRVAVAESYYTSVEDAADHRVLIASGMKTTLKELEGKITSNDDQSLRKFLKSHSYYLPSLKEMNDLHTTDELENTILISEACQEYKVGGQPLLPEFPCPDQLTPDQYLWRLCEETWKNKIAPKIPKEKHPQYLQRLEEEFKVLSGAGLSSYFLMTQDYINHARNVLKCRVGKGRGSAAGCMVSYLTGITGIDPIRFNLLFERFYNAGRNTKDRIAFPDIDTDFEVEKRDEVIAYIINKYGHDKACHIATFGRMQGRGALKDVLRAHGSVEFAEMNKITKFIPDEARITEDLQEMFDDFGESSIIRWALENNGEDLKEWCWIKETINDGKDIILDGPLSIEFSQAIRMEGTYRSQGRHASGIIVSSVPIHEVAPMVYDSKTKTQNVGLDMRIAEQVGLIKVDILGLLALDRISLAEKIIRTGHF